MPGKPRREIVVPGFGIGHAHDVELDFDLDNRPAAPHAHRLPKPRQSRPLALIPLAKITSALIDNVSRGDDLAQCGPRAGDFARQPAHFGIVRLGLLGLLAGTDGERAFARKPVIELLAQPIGTASVAFNLCDASRRLIQVNLEELVAQ